jgi:hypothetical protein
VEGEEPATRSRHTTLCTTSFDAAACTTTFDSRLTTPQNPILSLAPHSLGLLYRTGRTLHPTVFFPTVRNFFVKRCALGLLLPVQKDARIISGALGVLTMESIEEAREKRREPRTETPPPPSQRNKILALHVDASAALSNFRYRFSYFQRHSILVPF